MLKMIAAAMPAVAIAVSAWAGVAEDKALKDAALDLDLAAVRSALKNGANPNASDSGDRRTPLGQVALANLKGLGNPSPEAKKAGFMEIETVHSKALEIAKVLFAAGAKLGRYDREILFVPISSGNEKLVALLIDRGASVTREIDGYTPTELAKRYGQEAVYALLVSRGGILVDSQAAAQLALIQAASIDDIEGMERAIKNGATANPVGVSKETPLTAGLQLPISVPSRFQTIWWLLDHKADPNQKDADGDPPLHIFVRANRHTLSHHVAKVWAEPILERLLQVGAKVSGADAAAGQTPLHIAARYDNVRAAEMLIKESAKVMARDKMGKTPLDYAESAAMIKLLKSHGAIEH